ncbi:DUF1237 domain protein [Protomyces lactucae-debilis]|uniref:DUF1237 domain protein n=1 Tax=Protomyces lactucae-debilis TaxID=2754530 RepID=A0A1Y2FCH7_PROLT|nr:DUF1237 domain protein [Protomyces lactucae-debilis]ORY81613.1 DUF1237 domain protein [Protomyces lactucae-debilis]
MRPAQLGLLSFTVQLNSVASLEIRQHPLSVCPKYLDFARRGHPPYSEGKRHLPSQRPVEECRTFVSQAIEDRIDQVVSGIADPDMALLFGNCFASAADTTIRWHNASAPETFVITGDINAMWLRDSAFQLEPYLDLASKDNALQRLVLGAIQTQARYIKAFPYCNAFQAPASSGIKPASNGQHDRVRPPYDPDRVFECKYEIDSLAAFLRLSRKYFEQTKDIALFTQDWAGALQQSMRLFDEQSRASFDKNGHWSKSVYAFERQTDKATETLALDGAGYPVNEGSKLVKSSFRPSDDATILPLFIPGNAMLSVELKHVGRLLQSADTSGIGRRVLSRCLTGSAKVYEHGVFEHPEFGQVLAYEVDGYGGRIVMDDANIPSLLSLPILGFLDKEDPIYRATRKMILSRQGNPYYLAGKRLSGIGSPHTPLRNIWPMSLIVQLLTSVDKAEISSLLETLVSNTGRLGLMHESINVSNDEEFTRPWFSW